MNLNMNLICQQAAHCSSQVLAKGRLHIEAALLPNRLAQQPLPSLGPARGHEAILGKLMALASLRILFPNDCNPARMPFGKSPVNSAPGLQVRALAPDDATRQVAGNQHLQQGVLSNNRMAAAKAEQQRTQNG